MTPKKRKQYFREHIEKKKIIREHYKNLKKNIKIQELYHTIMDIQPEQDIIDKNWIDDLLWSNNSKRININYKSPYTKNLIIPRVEK